MEGTGQPAQGIRLTRRGRLAITAAVLAVVVGATAYLLFRTPAGTALGVRSRPPCTIQVAGETREWTWAQAGTATTVTGVGLRIGASENGVAAAVARSLRTERDTALDAARARQIYRELPDRARPRPESVALARVLLGHDDGALSCTMPLRSADLAREDPGPLGLTPRADALRLAMRDVFGAQLLGGFEPQGVAQGHIDGSAHYEGRAIDVFFRPVTEANQRRGWAQAQWAVAHAAAYRTATVIFDRRIWSARRSVNGWRDYRYPGGPTDNPVLLHEDHVHVDVGEGD